jgi:hypothetical protein
MKRLLVQDRAQNTKNRMITLLPPILTIGGGGGMEELANTILHYLVVVHSSQVRSMPYITYGYYYFA